jgi:hypothetical protein
MVPRTVTSLSKKIANKCLKGGGFKSQSADRFFVLLVSTYRHAALCQRTLRQKMEPGVEPSDIAVMKVSWDGTITRIDGQPEAETASPGPGQEPIFAITHPTELQLSARYLWQHTGFGISSRRSDFWLEQGPFGPGGEVEVPVSPYDAKEVNTARAAMRSRIAAGNSAPEENVFLYSGGMAAITETAMAIQTLRDPEQNSPCCAAVFGFVLSPTPNVLTHPNDGRTGSSTSTPSKFSPTSWATRQPSTSTATPTSTGSKTGSVPATGLTSSSPSFPETPSYNVPTWAVSTRSR